LPVASLNCSVGTPFIPVALKVICCGAFPVLVRTRALLFVAVHAVTCPDALVATVAASARNWRTSVPLETGGGAARTIPRLPSPSRRQATRRPRGPMASFTCPSLRMVVQQSWPMSKRSTY